MSERGEGQTETVSSQAVGNDIFLSEDDVPALMKILSAVTYKWEMIMHFDFTTLCVWVTGSLSKC